jgi:FKBP-type peptidyl-prolyl cis-trans isomerase FkpA/FKBP-type peptidyl-prolyl cis-trans isomerase FklB
MNVAPRFGLLAASLCLALPLMAAELETEEQKLGYLFGMQIGQSLVTNGTPIDIDSLLDAVRTVYEGGTPAMTEEEAAAVGEAFMAKRQAEMAAEQAQAGAANKAQGDAFLATNATAEGVQTTASGLQYKVLTQGTGAKPQATDTVTVHYRGTLLDGTEFDSSIARGEPISYPLNQVIKGWT